MTNCSSSKNGKFSASLLLIKNGYLTTTQREKSHGISPVIHQHSRQSQISMALSLCSVFGGISRVTCTTELLHFNGTITGNRYQLQLMRLSRVLKEKWPQYEQGHDKVILQHKCSISCRTSHQNILGNGKFYTVLS